jgi:rod shape-determining protein MreC
MVTISTTKQRKYTLPPVTTLIVVLVFSLAIITVWCTESTGGILHTVRSGFQTVTGTMESAGSWISFPFKVISNASTNAGATSEQLTELEEKNEELRATVIQLEEYRQENKRLSSLLQLSDAYDLESVGARVISQSSDAWNRTITIDKGKNNGVRVGMPVLSANGLLGQIEIVGATSSVIRLITDEQSGVSVLIQSSRAGGVLSGSVEGLLYLRYISVDQQVSVGDAVVTSGLGGSYPKGIVVGEVARVTKNDNDLYYTIVVQPITAISMNEEVLVLTGDETSVTGAS